MKKSQTGKSRFFTLLGRSVKPVQKKSGTKEPPASDEDTSKKAPSA